MTSATQPVQRPVRDAMLDIETLGKEPGCIVLSVGIAVFDPYDAKSKMHYDEKHQLYLVLSYMDSYTKQLEAGDPTAKWWQKQKIWPELSSQATNSNLSLQDACERISKFLVEQGIEQIWAKGKDFDVPILQEVFRRCKVEWPLHYRRSRDARDLCTDAFPGIEHFDDRADWPDRPKELQKFDPHHALGDALLQIHQVQQAYKVLTPPPRPLLRQEAAAKAAPRP